MIKGERLKKLRIEKNLTQEDLANMIGVTKPTICLYEKEKRSPSIENIIDFMMIFNVSSDYLIGADYIINDYNNSEVNSTVMTKEEIIFINELKKNKLVYNILFDEPKRGADLINKKIG